MRPHARQRTGLAVLAITPILLASCATAPDDAEATRIFSDCLTRNGIDAESVEVTMGTEGYVEGISLVINGEGSVAYEPTVRLLCTHEVEADR